MASNIPWITIVIVAFITHIRAETNFTKYNVLKNKRADLFAISLTGHCSIEECSLRCNATEGCRKANWFRNTCELLGEPLGNTPLVDDYQIWFLCEYM